MLQMGSKIVLVTGTLGLIAEHIVDNLLSKAYRVIEKWDLRENIKICWRSIEVYRDCQLEFEAVSDICVDEAFDKLIIDHPEL